MRNQRAFDELRPIKYELNYLVNPQGSVFIQCGNTKVICTAMIEDKVPYFLKGKGTGWLSCEYSMIPGSTKSRKVRDISRGKIDGRNQEIQRLIGRSLRASLDLKKIADKTIWIDCDVISADGGTRTASINGAYIALYLAIDKALKEGIIEENPIKSSIAAISVGIVNGKKLLDLDYKEDFSADVDLNLVMNNKLEIIEIQGTSENEPMDKRDLYDLIDLAEKGIKEIFKNREEVLTKREKIVLSSDNKNKILEIKDILRGLPVDLLSKSQVGLGDMEVEENFESLEENAQIKEQEIKKRVDLSVIADDTGLFVEALNGEPGVHSARYAGEHDDAANRRKLLESMKEKENRKAYFKTVISYIEKSGKEHLFQGICQGEIIREERGENGFGYDSLFLPKGFNKTFAEMTEEDKNKISHRSKALEEFRKFLEEKHS